jgi:tetratricopeptide (TPR) repeat protein
MFLRIGELDFATHCLLQAVDIDFSNADAYYYLGSARALRGKHKDAAEFFAHALDINGEHIPCLRDSSYTYLVMNRLDDAARNIKKALSLAADDKQLKTLSRKILLTQTKKRIADFLSRLKPRFISRYA